MRDDEDAAPLASGSGGPPQWTTTEERWAAVELNIQMAIRRGEFDNLPGAGKPIENLGQANDPDWWIHQKIQNEELTGLAPPVFQLRNENEGIEATIDSMSREADVRQHLEDFNARIRQARMQLMGGPPVVTPLRDVDEEVRAWRERRKQKPESAVSATSASSSRKRWWR